MKKLKKKKKKKNESQKEDSKTLYIKVSDTIKVSEHLS